MAEIRPKKIFNERNDIVAYEWLNMTDGDTALEVDVPFKADKTVQVSDNFGSNGDIRIQGSLDPAKAVFSDLHDAQGDVIAFTAANIETILENVNSIRPRVAAGTSVSVDIRVLMA